MPVDHKPGSVVDGHLSTHTHYCAALATFGAVGQT